MKNIKTSFISVSLLIIACAGIVACSTQKESASNRALQNLSARYNLIYNSNVLLGTYQDNILQNLKNDYDRILPVYYAPFFNAGAAIENESKELKEISQKAQNLVAEKKFSNYVDDAYVLLGKTSFYKGNYFNAYEYFDYVAKTYGKESTIFLNATNWKARSLMQLGEDQRAVLVLDTLKDSLAIAKKTQHDSYATLAQMAIYQNDYPNAIENLVKAVTATNKKSDKIRWNYILGQLYERIKDYNNSLKYYHKVEKSNAAFDMYFNAKLSKIRINDLLNDQTFNRQVQLLRLLRDDKNIDFVDQIYFEVAEDYYSDGNLSKAEEYYNLSVRKSTVNITQKGLSYLKIADLNFKDLSDYVKAKLYYDSAITVLPKNYPSYDLIVKKAQNLQYLTQRYETIKLEDTLQRIALLPEGSRKAALENYFTPNDPFKVANSVTVNNGKANRDSNSDGFKSTTTGTFYFANSAAAAKGFNDFKKRFGNRKLTDNWRQSVKPTGTTNASVSANDGSAGQLPTNPDEVAPVVSKDAAIVSNYLDSLPLTAEQKAKSDQKIILAYFEIASFYQQVLNDNAEAIKVYQTLLARFPKNNYLDVIYYSLYISYKGIDKIKSDQYKNLVLTNYPSSVYAKTILDPSFSLKQSALEETIQKDYNDIYAKFEAKDFNAVKTGVNTTLQRFPGNNLEPQYAYLKAIAIGRTSHVDSLITAFKSIVTKYPTDRLIKPLVDEHLLYINANLSTYKKRSIALVDFDPNEPRFIAMTDPVVQSPQKETISQPVPLQKPVADEKKIDPPVIAKNNIEKQIVDKKVDTPIIVKPKPDIAVVAAPEKVVPQKVDNLFSTTQSSLYYMVITVNRTDVSLSSSRFGIGQFNRGNYAGSNYRHQLREFDEDQLIYIGDFESYNEAKNYEAEISKQLSKIMKVPPTNYTTFAISKENFDKITDRATLIRYQNFIKLNEQ